jgi:DNA (cytosine-5)-methyltransferase 1
LISSPAKQRGRDFAVFLSCLNGLGYTVEWRIVNAGEYGFPQRRRRIFILGYKNGSAIQKKFAKVKNVEKWLSESGVTQRAFPGNPLGSFKNFQLHKDPAEVSKSFNLEDWKNTPFLNSGVAHDFVVTTIRMSPEYKGKQIVLSDILIDEKDVPEEYFINKKDLEKWTYLKGGKNEKRKAKNGFEFTYSEGPVAFPDPLDKPSRTIITSEGGSTPSRFKHVVKTKKGLRRLTPIELERLCMFPENHTDGNTDTRRAFFMGNALVVGVIDKLGETLIELHIKK